jgi:hypothetical protein
MYTKTITVDTNWLDAIDGRTVAHAIEYLKGLNKDYVLDCYLDGDTHGCEIVARLCYDVPMSNEEILAEHEARYKKALADYERAVKYYTHRNQPDRLPDAQRLRDAAEARWIEMQQKYRGEE